MSKLSVLGVSVDAVTYEEAIARIAEAAKNQRPFGVSALAVHGLMTAPHDPEHLYRINRLELVTPDGQPVRWFLNLKHRAGLPDRVYGPALTEKLLRTAARERLPVYFYGSTAAVIGRLLAELRRRYPGLPVAGAEPSRFRCLSPEEKRDLVRRIRGSGARILFVGLGCPRQEIFAHEFKHDLSMPVLAVGAAFDYLSRNRKEPPKWVQDRGLQWLFRLLQEPRRLLYRYTVYNTEFVVLSLLDLMGLRWRLGRALETTPVGERLFG